MPINWTAEMDQKFLLAVVKNSNIKIDFPTVAEDMSKSTGQEITTSALQNRFHRLKVQAGKAPGEKQPSKSTGEKASNKAAAATKQTDLPSYSNSHKSAKEINLRVTKPSKRPLTPDVRNRDEMEKKLKSDDGFWKELKTEGLDD